MNVIRLSYFIATIVAVTKSSAEADNGSVLSLSESKHIARGSGSNDEKETGNKEETSSVNQSAKRMLEAGTKRLLKFISMNDYDDSREEEYEEIFTVRAESCSMSDDFLVIGASSWNTGAAYLFNLNGTEVAKLTPVDDGEDANGDYGYFDDRFDYD